MPEPIRVAYTLEQCWHHVPGGTAAASLQVARRLVDHAGVELIGVAGRHRRPPTEGFEPPVHVQQLMIARPWLYETWNRLGRPRVERATGPIDVCHSTTAIPAATAAPHVVTVHDVAFVHTPDRFTRHGARVMSAGLDRCRHADLVLCPSAATVADLVALGFDRSRLRLVPWGVEAVDVTDDDRERVTRSHDLPDRFILFVGTLEPRKNLARLVESVGRLDDPLALVVVGPAGWGDSGAADVEPAVDARFLGRVGDDDLAAIYDRATVFAYPSLQEGFGLPVAEAMAQGTPVVTSRGTATEEVAGGAAVLIDPHDVDSITSGLAEALDRSDDLTACGLERAAELTWSRTVEATVEAYREAIG